MAILKRKIKLIIFFIIFIIISPIIVLYAKGDIFTDGWSILKTGGIYVEEAPIGSEVILNSKSKETTSFFNRNVLIKNLRPGTYEVKIKKEGYNTWFKKIKVSNNLVSDADVFMLPEKIETREIPKYMEASIDSTSTKVVKINNQEYVDIMKLFTATSTKLSKTASTTNIDFKSNLGISLSPIMNNKLGVWKEKTKIFVQWFGRNDSAPKYLCDKNAECTKSRLVFELAKESRKLNFLPGYDGVILVATEGLVFAVQIEDNPDKMVQIVYKGKNPDFRLKDNLLYVKDGEKIFEILL